MERRRNRRVRRPANIDTPKDDTPAVKEQLRERIRGKRTEEPPQVATVSNEKIETYNFDNIERLRSYPDFHAMLTSKDLTNLLGDCYTSNRTQLEKKIEDPRTSIGELQAIVLSSDAIDADSSSRMKSKEYIDNRLFGKVKDRVEWSGTDGAPLQIESKTTLSLDDLSLDELDKLESTMLLLMEKEKGKEESDEE